MANNTVEVRFSKVVSNGENGNQIIKQGKTTSSLTQFSNKSQGASGLAGNIVKGIRTIRTFNVTSTLGSFGGATPAVAIAQEITRGVKQAVGLYIDYQTASTGETMKYHNMRQTMNAITNPGQFIKKAIWEEGVLRNLEIARQNTALDYERQLTGNLYYAKLTQHNMI